MWLLHIAIFLPLAILGIPVIAMLAAGGAYRMRFSPDFGRSVLQFPKAFWIWSNAEDGVDGLRGGAPAQDWWRQRTAGWSDTKRVFVWAAIRNPVDSLRLVPFLCPKLEPSKVRSIGMDHEPQDGEGGWYFAWLAGTPYACIRYETKHFRFWLGTKIHPEDVKGLQPGDARAVRCDFSMQFKRVAP